MRILLLIFCSLIIAGCDLFSVRDAEPPDQPRASYQQAITPEILIENFRISRVWRKGRTNIKLEHIFVSEKQAQYVGSLKKIVSTFILQFSKNYQKVTIASHCLLEYQFAIMMVQIVSIFFSSIDTRV